MVFVITHDRLLDHLHYDPNTGLFTWRKPRPKVRVGMIAGTTTNSHSRRSIVIDGKAYLGGRLAWFYVTGHWPKEQIDHINRVGTDDRFANLREATQAQNQQNTAQCGKHGLKGIRHNPTSKRNPWCAQISHNRKNIHLGVFDTPEKAHAAYTSAARRLRGKFAHG